MNKSASRLIEEGVVVTLDGEWFHANGDKIGQFPFETPNTELGLQSLDCSSLVLSVKLFDLIVPLILNRFKAIASRVEISWQCSKTPHACSCTQ